MTSVGTFLEFIRVKGEVGEKQLPYYQRWIELYLNLLKRAEKDTANLKGFILFLSNNYEDWQVKQARHAIQLL
jgi:hypothetical protein